MRFLKFIMFIGIVLTIFTITGTQVHQNITYVLVCWLVYDRFTGVNNG